MKPIEVFYHYYIPADIRFSTWTWCLDQQLSLIKQSSLPDVAKINMGISMPSHWTHGLCNIPFRQDQHRDIEINFETKVREYINQRYPFVDILDVRDAGQPNLFEGQTLKLLHDRCKEVDIDVLYFHSKGTISASAPVACWREILNHYCITKWPSAVNRLSQADVVGVKDASSQDLTMSGNFWWSKSSHIKNLPNPLSSNLYTTDPNYAPDGGAYRYAFEQWALANDPTVDYLVDTKTVHYDDYCFLENLLKNN